MENFEHISNYETFYTEGFGLFARRFPAKKSHKPTVLMLHGSAHTGDCFITTLNKKLGWAYVFNKNQYNVIVPDLPTIGRSKSIQEGCELNGNYVIESLAGLIKSIKGKVVLLTHSLSGAYGWKLAEIIPDQIEKIIGVSPSPPGNLQENIIKDQNQANINIGNSIINLSSNKEIILPEEFVDSYLIGNSTQFPKKCITPFPPLI
jgi:pimeloyl-ACP methyl ester carboxylesterase